MALDISVNHDRCVGSTMCVLTADAVFALDEDGQSVVTDPDGADTATVVDAGVRRDSAVAISGLLWPAGQPVSDGGHHGGGRGDRRHPLPLSRRQPGAAPGGSTSVNVAPWPGTDVTRTSPPCSRARPRLM